MYGCLADKNPTSPPPDRQTERGREGEREGERERRERGDREKKRERRQVITNGAGLVKGKRRRKWLKTKGENQ